MILHLETITGAMHAIAFIAKSIDTIALKKNLIEVFSLPKVEIIFETKDTLWCTIDGVKVSFISRFDTLLEPAQQVDSFRLASVKDITVMKLVAVCGREEYKDYFDLACIGEGTDTRSWVSWWQCVYPEQDITSWVVALSVVDSIQKIPLEIAENFKNKNVFDVIKSTVQDVTKQVKLIEGIQ